MANLQGIARLSKPSIITAATIPGWATRTHCVRTRTADHVINDEHFDMQDKNVPHRNSGASEERIVECANNAARGTRN
jgi:hypothetical protein